MCGLAGFSRAGYYRSWVPAVSSADELEVRDCAAEDRAGVARLWHSPDKGGTGEARLESEPETRAAPDAGRQSAVRGKAKVRCHHRLGPPASGLPESTARNGADRH